jgi:hypothetical protein
MIRFLRQSFNTFAFAFQNPGALVISMATTGHVYEGVVLLLTNSGNGSVGMNALLSNIPGESPYLLSAALLLISALSIYAMHNRTLPVKFAAALLIPQQLLLLITFLGALIAAITGHYADGYSPNVPDPWAFISTDQVWRILIAPFYTAAIFARSTWYGHGRFGSG